MKISKSTLWLIIIYSLAHLPIFILGDALFWDDWTIFPQSAEYLHKDFLTEGMPWFAYFHIFMRQFGGFGYHLCTFISFGLAALLLPAILKYYGVEEKTAFWTAAIFAVVPVNQARSASIVVTYAVSYGLFFLAWYLLIKSKSSRYTYFLRFASLTAFVISYCTQSFLVFYALPIGLLFITETRSKTLVSTILRHLDFIALPIIFFTLKAIYFTPYGHYTGYNGLHWRNLRWSLHFLMILLTEIHNWQTPAAGFAL